MSFDPFADHPISYESARSIGCFRAYCVRVVDGDTYDFILDLGLTVRVKVRVRLRGLDTAEIFHPRNQLEKDHGEAAKEFVESLILGKPCLIRTYRTSSGTDLVTVDRYVADVYWYEGSTLETMLSVRDLKIALEKAGFAKHASYDV